MVKRVVYAYYLPLNASLERLYGLDWSRARGANVEYWDLSSWHYPNHRGPALERPYVRKFAAFADFQAAAAAEDIAAFVCVMPFCAETLNEFRVLSSRPAPLLYYAVGVQPTPPARQRLGALFNPRKLGDFLGNRKARLARAFGLVRPYDVVFAAGAAAAEAHAGKRIIPIRHPDFDEAAAAGDETPPVDGKYAVFLDDNLPHHPDLAVLKVKKAIDAPLYYRALNAYFDALERRHGLKVVVAAHPKADYRDNPFGGRPVFRGETRRLVRFCSLALTTISSSQGFAVLYRKPLIFVTSQDIVKRYGVIRLDAFPPLFAKTLDRPCVDLDAPSTDLPPVDEKLYADYEGRYLASAAAKGRPSRESCLELFKELGAVAQGALC